MTTQDELSLKNEIQHIFDSGANEVRILEMVKTFIEKRGQALYIHDVTLSAYFVDIKHTKIVVLAKNIADACDKLDRDGFKDYTFIYSYSFDVIS